MRYISDTLHYYRSYRLRSILLNLLLIEKEIPFDKIAIKTAMNTDKTLRWSTFTDDISPELIFLIETGLLSLDKKAEVVAITDKGVAALLNGIIDEAANSAFRNFINIRLQYIAIFVSFILVIVSICSIFL